ncbi:MAG: heme-binding domain-containing protein [Solirubrobacteraceae bacterium]
MSRRARRRRGAVLVLGVLAGAFVLLQLVPYGHDHSAPPTTKRARLDPAAAAIAAKACMDCHSNHTRWPWYTDIAPASFLAVSDVKGGREHLNLSRWDKPQPGLGDVVESITGGGMPPTQYTLIHSSARLSAGEKRVLAAGFRALYAADPPPPGGGG